MTDSTGMPVRRAITALLGATALAVPLTGSLITSFGAETTVTVAMIKDEEPEEPPDEEPCPPNGYGGNHSESVVPDRW